MPIHLSEDQFGRLVQEAIESIPPQFEPYMENVVVEVRPAPTRDLMRQAHYDGPGDLLGLYVGVPLPDKSVSALVDWPERVYIFQRNIESICDSPQDVVEEVRLTVLHEIGHHFGMDEDDLDELGFG